MICVKNVGLIFSVKNVWASAWIFGSSLVSVYMSKTTAIFLNSSFII